MMNYTNAFGKVSSASIPNQLAFSTKFANTLAQFTNKVQEINPNEQQEKRYKLTNFLVTWFDFTFFLMVCPFRVVSDINGKFIIKKFRPQQVCCIIVQTLCLIRLATEVRVSIEREYRCKSISKNPVQYFNIILDVCSLIYKCVTMKRLWFNQVDYLQVLNYIRGREELEANTKFTKTIQNVIFLRVFFSLITTHVFVSLCMGKGFIDGSSSWSSSLWRNQLVKLARFTFFVDESFKKSNTTMLKEITSTDDFLAFVMALSMIARFMFGLFCDTFLLSFTMTLWSAAKTFSRRLSLDEMPQDEQEDNPWMIEEFNETTQNPNAINQTNWNSWPEVYSNFRVIQILALRINRALGSQVTWYMAEAIMYYSIFLNAVLTSFDVFVRVDLTIFYFNTFAILLISADICSQIENIKQWISYGDNRKAIPNDEFNIVLHELVAKDIGIRGSDIYTITWSLISLFFSTIVTYFIICIQQGHDGGLSKDSGGNATMTCDI